MGMVETLLTKDWAQDGLPALGVDPERAVEPLGVDELPLEVVEEVVGGDPPLVLPAQINQNRQFRG